MSLAKYLFFMILTTSTCWLFWLFVLFKISPLVGEWFPATAFFTTLSLALWGSLSTLGLLARIITKKQRTVHDRVLISFRQGLWLTIIIAASLALLHARLFTPLHILLLIGSMVLAELLSVMVTRKY